MSAPSEAGTPNRFAFPMAERHLGPPRRCGCVLKGRGPLLLTGLIQTAVSLRMCACKRPGIVEKLCMSMAEKDYRPMHGPRIRYALCALLLLLAVSACGHAIPINPTIVESSAPPRVAASVGVYFSEEFRAFEHSGNRGGDTWVFPLGPASVGLFTKVFDQVFEGAETVRTLPPLGPEHSDLAAVIETRIEEFDFHIPFLKTQTFTAEITYRFVLHAASGEPVASWTVTGEGAKPGSIGFEIAKWPGQAADAALEDAAQKFARGITNEPEVRRWLRGRGLLLSGTVSSLRQIEGDGS